MMNHLLGCSVLFILKDGNDILLKVTQDTSIALAGYDDEGCNMSIIKTDILDYMIMK